jgi:ligand-binding sensor domain-containing protein
MTYDNRSGLLSNGVFYLGMINSELWVGTYGGGLSIFTPATRAWRNYNIPDGLADAFVYDVLKTRSGDIWIATWSGANRIADDRIDDVQEWRLYTVENTQGGLPNDWVYGLAEGKSGEIWLATEGGLARFADGQWQHWNHEDGLGAAYDLVAADIPFKRDPGDFSGHHAIQKKEQGLEQVKIAYNPNYIVSLAVDDRGDVWAGTWGGGLSHFDGSQWVTFTVRDGLPGNHVFALETDGKGNLWIGTNRGLAIYDGNGFKIFGTAEGLYTESVFSIAFAPDGSAWLGGLGGVTWFQHGLPSHGAATSK